MNWFDRDLREKTGIDGIIARLELQSALGSNLCRRLHPTSDTAKLACEYDNTEKCLPIVRNKSRYSEFAEILKQFKDIGGTFKRCEKRLTLDECELFEIKNFAILTEKLRKMPKPKLAGTAFSDLSGVVSMLDPNGEGTASFYIYDAYSPALSEIRLKKADIERKFYSADVTGRKSLSEKRAAVSEAEKREELKVRERLTDRLSVYCQKFSKTAESAARLDLSLAKAKMAADYNMCRPALCGEHCVKIKNGIHPAVKESVEKRGGRFFPVTIECRKGVTIITGANMGGKTVALGVIALNSLMACMGFFAFAQSFSFCPPDFISFLSDTQGAFENGLSTFGADVTKLKTVLEKMKNGTGLVLIDEFARGTNPAEGSGLVKALAKYLNARGSVSVLTTHYDGVSVFAGAHYQVRGLKSADFEVPDFQSGSGCAALIAEKMDYTLEKTDCHDVPRDALRICSLFGIDKELILSAYEFLKAKEESPDGEQTEP